MNKLIKVSDLSSQFEAEYQPEHIESFLGQLGHQAVGGCTEIRIITSKSRLKGKYVGKTISGFYNDYQAAAKDISQYDGQASVYCSLQACDPKLLRRSHNRLEVQAKHATSDQQIVAYLWALLDIDPERPADTASSDQELQLSADLLARIKAERLDPLNINLTHAISGNGVHGLIPIESQLPIDQTGLLVKEILEALDREYSTDQVKVDTSVFNPSRITKVYGTMAIKGDNTEEAPHRRSICLPAKKEPITPHDIQQLHQALCPSRPKRNRQTTIAAKSTVSTDNQLEEILTSHGLTIAFVTEKDEGRYLTLEECPFNSDHRRDAAVIQGHNGSIGFKCFHDSCQGKSWPQVQIKLGISAQPTRLSPLTTESDSLAVPLPTIVVNNRSLATVTQESLQAIQNSNQDQPAIFHMNNELLRVVPGAEGDHKIELLTRDSLKGVMTRTANFVNQSQKGEKHRFPPSEVAADILSLPTYSSIPLLRGILPHPLVRPDGSISGTSGYDDGTGFIHSGDYSWLGSESHPILDSVEEAKEVIDEVLQDFIFADNSSRTNAIALCITPFTRLLIDGLTPAFAITAPTPGSGKGLLAKALIYPSLGREPAMIPEVESEGEQRKQISALLLTAPTHVVIDNIKKPITSGSLASVLTTNRWLDRKLGSNSMLELSNQAIWLLLGNNLEADSDLVRRMVAIQLDPGLERPWEREEFQHPDLIDWVKQNRIPLVRAGLTLVRNWVLEGSRLGPVQIGSFESWARAMSGILECAGIEGLMGNRRQLEGQLNLELEAWGSFFTCWHQKYQDKKVGITDLFELACYDEDLDDEGPLEALLGEGSPHSLRARLGKQLSKHRGQVIAGYLLTDARKRRGAQQWQLLARPEVELAPLPSLPSSGQKPVIVRPELRKQPDDEGDCEGGEGEESKNSEKKNEMGRKKSSSITRTFAPSPPSPQVPTSNIDLDWAATNTGPQNQLEPATEPPAQEMMNPPAGFHLVQAEDDLAWLLDDYLAAEFLAIDIETIGLDPLTDQIRLVQMAAAGLPTLVVDLFQYAPALSQIAPLLTNSSVKVMHNAKFELKFLLQNGVGIEGQIFDTMLAEQLLHAGIREHGSKLEQLVEFHLKQPLNKGKQTSDWSGDLTRGQLVYAARDAAVLLPLREILVRSLVDQELVEVAQLEFDCVRAVAQMELAGIRVDADQWKDYCQLIKQNIGRYESQLQRHFAEWSQLQNKPINLRSTQQLQLALASLGIEVKSTKQSTLEAKSDSIVVADLLQYKHWQSQDSKYADKILQSIHPQTNRIHADYRQLGTDTGRLSCSNPPLQQIPTQAQVRSCFIPANRNKFVLADYSQIELRVAAQISQDQRMIETYQKGEDLHRLTASVLTGTPIIEVTDEQRQAAKAVNFGLLFAMGAKGLRSYARNTYGVEMSLEQARQFKQRFFDSYAGFAAFLQNSASQKAKQLRTMSGRIRHFTQGYASLPNVLNTPIQGTAADIIKRALADLPAQLIDTGAQIVACIHDEIILEVETDQAERVKQVLEQVMVAAGEHYLTQVPVVVEAKIADSWAGK